MRLLSPDVWFDRLAARFPGAWAKGLSACAMAGFLACAALVAFHLPLPGALFLVAALVADGWEQAQGRRDSQSTHAASPLGFMLMPFGFALHDPAQALAAMFLVLALAMFATKKALAGQAGIAGMHWLAGAGLILACLLPNYFSIIAYLVGITCFIAIGQRALMRE